MIRIPTLPQLRSVRILHSRALSFSAKALKEEPPSTSDPEKAPKLDETEADSPEPSKHENSAGIRNLGHELELINDFSTLREKYTAPQNPIVLCHGLFGFDEFHVLPGKILPGIEYWRGIREALELHGVEIIIASVPPSGSIERRAEALAEIITKRAPGRKVNLIGHSMGGLDARYLLSRLKPNTFTPLSLTTVATPHHGSPIADYILSSIPPQHLPRLYSAINAVGLDTDAFSQLTTKYMEETFNPSVPDAPDVGYYSYGARFDGPPKMYSWFRWSWGVIEKEEKARGVKTNGNDGLVSVESAKWGTYEGTLVGVSHLEVVNWYNRVEGLVGGWMGKQKSFNGAAFYCAVIEKLAKRGY